MKSKTHIKKFFPYILIILFNSFLLLLYPENSVQLIPNELILGCLIIFFSITKMKNLFNKIISISWLFFYFLGILNINSIKLKTDIWNLDSYNASFLYLCCLLIFTLSLTFFEKFKVKQIKFKDDLNILFGSPFTYILIIFPILLLISIYGSIGFLPILSGQSFVNEMYEYNYGVLYNYKFITVYSFCLVFFLYKKKKWVIISSLFILFLLFVVSVDGKRFILLLSLLTLVPISIMLRDSNSKITFNRKEFNNTPVILSFSTVGIVYILLNILRTGGDIKESLNLLVENIPFGVEFKDYVHSFNTYSNQTIKNYNFEWSAFGSFMNSSSLELLNLNKDELYQMGSQHAFMNLYNEVFGIRIGIVGELYFAYGLFVLPIMVIIAFFANRISQRILNPKSYFNLIQNSILFGLFVLLINGQATVFFGTLTIMIYTYFIYLVSSLLISKK
ncbi:oligosaccharide repeat unit polymerase [Flavobacterium sp. AED]|uniref:oligosaccharide repeat unit polymerase n=1 Tax=Flavobacterium sp. AED TaxID=1423323 RepID=UPI00058044DC|nr:oligosaccharide repeat unit polymerase [Flavobacterium sp. AED]KIA85290.1 hypothetical protein OA85_12940 [Flavobacterium sp. AED]